MGFATPAQSNAIGAQTIGFQTASAIIESEFGYRFIRDTAFKMEQVLGPVNLLMALDLKLVYL